MVKAGNDKFTVSIDKRVKDSFKKLCLEHGLQPGKQIELLLKKKIEELEITGLKILIVRDLGILANEIGALGKKVEKIVVSVEKLGNPNP